MSVRAVNCNDVGKGHAVCDNCANGKPELCRYMNTVGAMKLITSLQEQLAQAVKGYEARGKWGDRLQSQLEAVATYIEFIDGSTGSPMWRIRTDIQAILKAAIGEEES